MTNSECLDLTTRVSFGYKNNQMVLYKESHICHQMWMLQSRLDRIVAPIRSLIYKMHSNTIHQLAK